ncbi:hypothetical protein LRS10_07590 [Phenylobacterium sp. J426]|nr:hypothetical protein [Phenylobacterium sp. J426]MCR5874043.1 hypothetical protein [Phenylobacterium sp. J426]
MRLGGTLLILAAGLGLSAVVWMATGGRVVLFLLPLVFGLPLLLRRRT